MREYGRKLLLLRLLLIIPGALAADDDDFICKNGQFCRSRALAGILYKSEAEVQELCRLEPRCYAWDFNTVGGYGRLCSGIETFKHAMFKVCIAKNRPPLPPPPPPFDMFSLNNWDPACADKCCGNDDRCIGALKYQCDAFTARGVDCFWGAASADSVCSGNDSRCAGASHAMCKFLAAQGGARTSLLNTRSHGRLRCLLCTHRRS